MAAPSEIIGKVFETVIPGQSIQTWQWIVSSPAQRFLQLAEASTLAMPGLVDRLRRDLSAEQCQIVLSQVQLRRRGRQKFDHADRMFFTEKALQQATDQRVAHFKASCYAQGASVVDLCCGIGGDLLALAARGPVGGVDKDPQCVVFAQANCQAVGYPQVSVDCREVRPLCTKHFDAWHLDPDRRPAGRRTSRLAAGEPNEATIEQIRSSHPDGGVKLAPAAEVPQAWQREGQLEWIGMPRECKQLFVRFGQIAEFAGQRCATILSHDGDTTASVVGVPATGAKAQALGRFVYDPHPCLVAANLVGHWANARSLCMIDRKAAYLTGDDAVVDQAATALEVLEYLPFDRRRVKSMLRSRRIGRLEVKKRGTDHNPNLLQKQLRVEGDNTGVLIITPYNGRIVAILARRL